MGFWCDSQSRFGSGASPQTLSSFSPFNLSVLFFSRVPQLSGKTFICLSGDTQEFWKVSHGAMALFKGGLGLFGLTSLICIAIICRAMQMREMLAICVMHLQKALSLSCVLSLLSLLFPTLFYSFNLSSALQVPSFILCFLLPFF